MPLTSSLLYDERLECSTVLPGLLSWYLVTHAVTYPADSLGVSLPGLYSVTWKGRHQVRCSLYFVSCTNVSHSSASGHRAEGLNLCYCVLYTGIRPLPKATRGPQVRPALPTHSMHSELYLLCFGLCICNIGKL